MERSFGGATWVILWVALLVVGGARVVSGDDRGAPGEGRAFSLRDTSVFAEDVQSWVEKNLDAYLRIYEDFHANPELSFQERRTSRRVAEHLRKLGFEVTEGVGKTGVVGVLRNGSGPTVLFRGDMDALPVKEETGLPYASRAKGIDPAGQEVPVMHACGHDVHLTNLLAVADLLAGMRDRWRGTLVVVAQPAEEIGKGARAMIADGLFERFPKPDVVLAIHVASDLPAGSVGYTPGWFAANVDSVDITLYGRGGHGARPDQAVDPIVAAAHLVVALQTLVSRRVDPIDPAVVTVGSIHGGSKHNVIPDEVRLQLTVRSYKDEVRKLLLDGIEQLSRDVCRAFLCPRPPEVTVKDEYTPAAYNDPDLTQASAGLFRRLLGEENVVEVPARMGGEDFGLYARTLGVPGLLFRVGTVAPDRFQEAREGGPPLPSTHSSLFAPEPRGTIRTSVTATAHLLLALMGGD